MTVDKKSRHRMTSESEYENLYSRLLRIIHSAIPLPCLEVIINQKIISSHILR